MTPQKYLQNAETYRRLAEIHDLNARRMLSMVLDELDRALYWRNQAEAAEKAARCDWCAAYPAQAQERTQ